MPNEAVTFGVAVKVSVGISVASGEGLEDAAEFSVAAFEFFCSLESPLFVTNAARRLRHQTKAVNAANTTTTINSTRKRAVLASRFPNWAYL